MDSNHLSEEILHGAGEITGFLFGSDKGRRQVYRLARHKCLPVFRLGATLCARPSTLLSWIKEQESCSGDPSQNSQ